MSEIQLKLSEILNSSPNSSWKDPVTDIISNFLIILNPIHLDVVVKNFEIFGLTEHLEPIIDSLWKTNAPSIPVLKKQMLRQYDYPELRELDDLEDWRKIIKVWELVKNKNKLRYHVVL
jgi:hypothetical protein